MQKIAKENVQDKHSSQKVSTFNGTVRKEDKVNCIDFNFEGFFLKFNKKLGMVVHDYNLSTAEAAWTT